MKNRLSVALLIETSNAYARGLLDGIISFQREHELWSLQLAEHERGAEPPPWLKAWKGDGIIARIETEAIAAALQHLRVPIVDVSAARRLPHLPWIETDDEAFSELAVQHLAERGFRSLAFCGLPIFNWSQWREEAFVRYAELAGCQTSVFHSRHSSEPEYSWPREQSRLHAWLKSLHKPVGIMACYDFMGQQILDGCRDLSLAVPDEVAVIGCDNDDRLCNLCTPPMSSIVPDTFKTGYEAAELLNHLMKRKRIRAEGKLIRPLGIAQRQSTDVLAIEDPDIVMTLRTIRERACTGVTVAEILRVVPLSRRVLEHRFRKLLGRTPHDELLRLRVERASQLLRETDLRLEQVARMAGFVRGDYLSTAFRRQVGMSPSEYRRNTRRINTHQRT